MSNHLSMKFGGEVLRVGDRRDFRDGDFGETFHLLREPASNESTHILHDWVCPCCGQSNWAEVIFVNGVLETIAVVPFNRESVARAHYLSERIYEYYESVTGERPPTYDGLQLVERLLGTMDDEI